MPVSHLVALNITTTTMANAAPHIDAKAANKSPVSTYPSAVVRFFAGLDLSGAAD